MKTLKTLIAVVAIASATGSSACGMSYINDALDYFRKKQAPTESMKNFDSEKPTLIAKLSKIKKEQRGPETMVLKGYKDILPFTRKGVDPDSIFFVGIKDIYDVSALHKKMGELHGQDDIMLCHDHKVIMQLIGDLKNSYEVEILKNELQSKL